MPEKPELLIVFVVSCNLPAIEVSRRIQSRQPFAFFGLDIQTSDGSSNRSSDPNVPGKLGRTGAGQEPGLAQGGWCRYPGCLHGDRRHLELGIFRSTEKRTLLLHHNKRNESARQTRVENKTSAMALSELLASSSSFFSACCFLRPPARPTRQISHIRSTFHWVG